MEGQKDIHESIRIDESRRCDPRYVELEKALWSQLDILIEDFWPLRDKFKESIRDLFYGYSDECDAMFDNRQNNPNFQNELDDFKNKMNTDIDIIRSTLVNIDKQIDDCFTKIQNN